MRYISFSLKKLQAILQERGLKERDLVKMLYSEKSHQTFQTIFTKTIGVKKLIDICNALNLNMDSLFEITYEENEVPIITGNNTPKLVKELERIKSENETLKLLIKEKDSHIEDLKNNFERVVELTNLK